MDDKRVSTPQRGQACSVSLLFMSSHLRGIIGIMPSLRGDEKAQGINSLCHIQYYENRCIMSDKISDKLKSY
jgi:hypothetical protein